MLISASALLGVLVLANTIAMAADPIKINCKRWEFCHDDNFCRIVQRDSEKTYLRTFWIDQDHKLIKDGDYELYADFKTLDSWRSAVSAPYWGVLRSASGEFLFRTREKQRIVLIDFVDTDAIPMLFARDEFDLKYNFVLEEIDHLGETTRKFTDVGYCKKPANQ